MNQFLTKCRIPFIGIVTVKLVVRYHEKRFPSHSTLLCVSFTSPTIFQVRTLSRLSKIRNEDTPVGYCSNVAYILPLLVCTALAYNTPIAGVPAGGVYMVDGPLVSTELDITAVTSIAVPIPTAVKTRLKPVYHKLSYSFYRMIFWQIPDGKNPHPEPSKKDSIL